MHKSKNLRSLCAIVLILFAWRSFASNSGGGYSQISCSSMPTAISDLQRRQYLMQHEGKSLFDLEKEYDTNLSQAAILQELTRMNADMHAALSPAGDPIRSIVNHISNATSPENMSVYKQMAAMDTLIKNLAKETELNFNREDNVYPTYDDLVRACANVSNQAICDITKDSSDVSSQLYIRSFLEAYAANGASDREHAANLATAYRQVLRQGFSIDTSFQRIYDAAKALDTSKHSPAFAVIEQVENLGKDDHPDVLKLKQIRCCRLQNSQQVQADTMCSTIQNFQLSQCSEYRQNASASVENVIDAFSNYEQRVYDSLYFKFDNIELEDNFSQSAVNLNIPRRSWAGRILNSIGVATDERQKAAVTEELTTLVNAEGQIQTTVFVENMADNIQAQLRSIYRRGKVGKSDVSDFIRRVPTSEDSALELNYVASELNVKICLLESQTTGRGHSNCTPGNVIDKFVKQVNGRIVVADNAPLERIFNPNNDLNLQTELAALQDHLRNLKAKIDAIKGQEQFRNLEMVKAFMVWDLKDRCSNNNVDQFHVPGCHADPANNKSIDYLVSTVGNASNKLIAELDPNTISRVDLSNASLAQRRVIFSNLKGACSGLTAEGAPQLPNVPGVCERISALDTQVQRTTASEVVDRRTERGYYRTPEGRMVKERSTWSDIGIGAARALPGVANTLVPTYFQGSALRQSIPYQEQYYKNMKLYNYSNQWYLDNAPMFPGLGYWNSYGYGYNGMYTGPGSVSTSGFNFNTTGL